ncbi:MAG: TIGR04282 family arsenosugar biosynthesis glycosyltransferase [Halioglobus sp.]|nr:TIGR04282 family arsenosugar biosynthesis glycosyltransferase [Halioglobus sp.]
MADTSRAGTSVAACAGSGRCLLLQFARSPQPGKVKTRMLPALSAEQACELHCELVLWTCERLVASQLGEVRVCVAGNPHHPVFERCLAVGAVGLCEQRGSDLGERMFHALQQALASYERVILVGSDCPALDTAYLQAARAALEDVPVVIGPALDGGYVLIGARRIAAGVFQGIRWGGDEVYARTLENLASAGLAARSLAPLADVDRPADLPAWLALREGG